MSARWIRTLADLDAAIAILSNDPLASVNRGYAQFSHRGRYDAALKIDLKRSAYDFP